MVTGDGVCRGRGDGEGVGRVRRVQQPQVGDAVEDDQPGRGEREDAPVTAASPLRNTMMDHKYLRR